MQERTRKLQWLKTTQGASYKIEEKRDIQEIPAAELQEFTYDFFQVCAFDSIL